MCKTIVRSFVSRPVRILAWGGLLLSFGVFAQSQEQLTDLVARYFDPDFLERADRYHRLNLILFLLQSGVQLGVLFALARGPLGTWNQIALKATGNRPWLARVGFLTVVYSSLALTRLPFSIARYYHALSYGLRNDTLGIYLLDWFKGFVIIAIIVAILGLILLGMFAHFPRWWTILATSATGILAVTFTLFAPLIIDPLFYRFTALEEPVLKQRLLDLSARAGLEVEEILVADASRRSDSVNAYVNGIGGTARIVLYDTLLEKFTPEEVAIVLAHEIGHRIQEHIQKGLLLGILGLFIALWIADRVLEHCVRIRLRGIGSRADPVLVLPAYALYVVLMFAALVPGNLISRQMEREADHIALELTKDPDSFIRTKVRIAKANLSQVLPPTGIEFTLFTHPSIARRIWMAEKFREDRNGSAGVGTEHSPDRFFDSFRIRAASGRDGRNPDHPAP